MCPENSWHKICRSEVRSREWYQSVITWERAQIASFVIGHFNLLDAQRGWLSLLLPYHFAPQKAVFASSAASPYGLGRYALSNAGAGDQCADTGCYFYATFSILLYSYLPVHLLMIKLHAHKYGLPTKKTYLLPTLFPARPNLTFVERLKRAPGFQLDSIQPGNGLRSFDVALLLWKVTQIGFHFA